MTKFTAKNINSFISFDEAMLLSQVFELYKQPKNRGDDIGHCFELSPSPFFDLFLDTMRPTIEAIVGESLVPSYAFARQYLKGSSLEKHTDRPSCVYTCTLTLAGSSKKPWPICCEINGQEKSIHNKEGDLFVLRGCEVPHWRNELQSDEQLQLFLHYVPHEERYKDHYYDGRAALTLDLENSLDEQADNLDFDERKELFFGGVKQALLVIASRKTL